jgi:alkyl sulfatase BDS1-like metallo-beta-lactamase superfamily hydrolase
MEYRDVSCHSGKPMTESLTPAASPARSFDPSGDHVVSLPNGARGHQQLIEHLDVIRPSFVTVQPGVWCLIGNGLSNQTFVDAPEGIIAIDTGESNQEMEVALAHLRTVTDRPIVAVLYTHFHYVAGTEAILAESGAESGRIKVYGHSRIVNNRSRTSGEIAPAYSRGILQQFGTNLPSDGPDALIHVGLGLFYRNPSHAPFTRGFVEPSVTFDTPVALQIGGLQVHVTPAPSDADDSVTFWFPELSLCVNNIVWPVLFNVFAIRGEEYRDPRVLLTGLDHLLGLGSSALVGAHGPAIVGAQTINDRVTRARDAIQFLWDQTVRGLNKGFTADELAATIKLPPHCDADPLTAERYGVAEHHVRQIAAGLRGWFDGDPAKLFPLPRAELAQRLIHGFGGRAVVAQQAREAIDTDDLRWACELAAWLVASPHPDGSEAKADRLALANVLRLIAERSPAANIRNWCLTTARDLDGSASLDRQRMHRIRREDVLADPQRATEVLRVKLDPVRAAGIDAHILISLGVALFGLHIRNSVAVITDGQGASLSLSGDVGNWADVVTGAVPVGVALDDGRLRLAGDRQLVETALAAFDGVIRH